LFLSSEPNPDGNLFPGVTSAWRVKGTHTTYIIPSPFSLYIITYTDEDDCNLHFDQVY